MAVAEKYRVDKGFKWMGHQYERGDAISRATFLKEKQIGEARLGAMQRTGFISVVEDWRTFTNTNMVEYGREVGADVHPNMLKADLVDAIESEL